MTWTTGINYAYGTTKLTKLSNDIYQASYLDLYQKPGVGTSEYFFRVEEGGRIGQFYGYEYAGVDENHNMLVYNADGEKSSQPRLTPRTNAISATELPATSLHGTTLSAGKTST